MRPIVKAAACVLALIALGIFLDWLGDQREQCEARGGVLMQGVYLRLACVKTL